MASLFIAKPVVAEWGTGLLVFAYCLMGCGRATFEGTLRATFADFFPNDHSLKDRFSCGTAPITLEIVDGPAAACSQA